MKIEMNENEFNIVEGADLYQTIQDSLIKGFTVSEEIKETEYDNKEYQGKVYLSFLKNNYRLMGIGVLYLLYGIHAVYQLFALFLGIYNLNTKYIHHSLIYFGLWIIPPFLLWVFSTLFDFWNFHKRKLIMLLLCISNAAVAMLQLLFAVFSSIFFPIFASIPIGPDISSKMIFNLTRMVLLAVTMIPIIAFLKKIGESIYNPITKAEITKFKIGKMVDFRANKESAYDMNVVKNLETGEAYTIKEADRSLNALANGTTGTGKTSSLFTVAINGDFEKIAEMREKQRDRVLKLLKERRVRITKNLEDEEFCIKYFESVEGKKSSVKEINRKKNLFERIRSLFTERKIETLEDIEKKYPVAGVTTMAPNAAFSDEIYELARAHHLKVNRIDPTLSEDRTLKHGFRGFNPLYISPNLDRIGWIMEVSRKAVLFADVAQAVYDVNGQSDVYFAGLNRNLTTAVTAMILLTYPALHNGKQPTPANVQEVLNNFSRAKPYRNKMVELYGKKNQAGQVIMESGKADIGIFQTYLDVIDAAILGPLGEKIFDQSQGLRNVINSFLANPLIRNVLCAEDSIDLDQALFNSEITLVNYALELGTDATAFGLFFLLSFIEAVKRRPVKMRLPNFFYIDELPVLLHPKIETCFSLFRQYKVPMFVAIQSLSQMEKMASTAYLKEVLMGNCAHHFVFGRIALNEMQIYQELSGKSLKIMEMNGSSETSLSTENPTISFNNRETMQREYNIEGGDIRALDFQEVLVITVDQGSPVEAFYGKVSFLKQHKRIKKERKAVNWESYFNPLFEEGNADNNQENEISHIEKEIMAVDIYNEVESKENKEDFRLMAAAPRDETRKAEGEPEWQEEDKSMESITEEGEIDFGEEE